MPIVKGEFTHLEYSLGLNPMLHEFVLAPHSASRLDIHSR
jgi:hypothetical protein